MSVSSVIHDSPTMDRSLGLFDTEIAVRGGRSDPAAQGWPDTAIGGSRAGGPRNPGSAASRSASPRSAAGRSGARQPAAGGSGPSGPRAVPPLPQAAKDLLADAARGLGRAIRATEPADRYAAAHLAALRAAAAVLAARARPVRGRRGSAWELISTVAPEFGEWAAFFAAGSAKRQAAEAGIHRLVTAREADDMVRQVAAFLDLVDEALAPAGREGQRRTF